MSETTTEQQPVVTEPKQAANPFDETNWKETIETVATSSTETPQQPSATPTDKPTTDATDIESFDEKEYVKKNFGWEDPELGKKELEDLRKLKENPLLKFEFKNEESRKVLEYINEGKTDELYSFLDTQKKLTSAENLKAQELLKLHLQLTNKHFTKDDVQDVFEEKYSYPEKPERSDDEADDDYKVREDKWKASCEKIDRRLERDARVAKEDLAKLKTEIVLPNIQKGIDPKEAEAQQKELERLGEIRNTYLQHLESDFKNFNGFNVTYKNEDVEIPIAYKVTPEEQIALKNELTEFDLDTYFNSRWFDKDSKPNVKQIMSDIYYLKNMDKINQKLVNETAAQVLNNHVKLQKNISINGGASPATQIDNKTAKDKEVETIWGA